MVDVETWEHVGPACGITIIWQWEANPGGDDSLDGLEQDK
jgi:hypothetical protein